MFIFKHLPLLFYSMYYTVKFVFIVTIGSSFISYEFLNLIFNTRVAFKTF